MDDATANSLGDKLAALDLTDDEATLLGILLGGSPGDDDVTGFSHVPTEQLSLNYERIRFDYGANVGPRLGPAVKGWSWGETNMAN